MSSYISQNLKEDIKHKVSIIDLADEYFGVVKKGSLYSIKPQGQGRSDFSSILLYPDTNSFYRWSNSRGGDIISFVIETHLANISNYREAIAFLAKKINPEMNIEFKKREAANQELSPAQRHKTLLESMNIDSNVRNIVAYLIKERGINTKIVSEGISRGYIKQVRNENDIYYLEGKKVTKEVFEASDNPNKKFYHNENKNIAFIGRKNGAISNVCYRGINNASSFKFEKSASDRDWGWIWEIPSVEGKRILSPDARLYVFEGYIDMLSYLSLRIENGENINKDMYLSLGSATKYKAAINIADHYSFNRIVIAFDNDEAGSKYTNQLAKEMKERIEELNHEKTLLNKKEGQLNHEEEKRLRHIDDLLEKGPMEIKRVISRGKDWNVDLQKKRGIIYRGEKANQIEK